MDHSKEEEGSIPKNSWPKRPEWPELSTRLVSKQATQLGFGIEAIITSIAGRRTRWWKT